MEHTIDETKQAKLKLEAEIARLLKDFDQKYHCKIHYITIRQVERFDSEVVRYLVELDIRL
ncbi:hypothetical protein LCGC14_0387190 [marine sediment metagenome]|uniref:Uncharacterized protein n=1 Tax=marine sediment metagenome TaxID=412755 RepID=A0A0F9VMZ0_9ZZZZ